MTVTQKNVCQRCGLTDYMPCKHCTAVVSHLVPPDLMTGEARMAELLTYQFRPEAIAFEVLRERVQLLIGRRFYRPEIPPFDPDDSAPYVLAIAACEDLPHHNNNAAWEALAQEARVAYS